MSLVPNKNQFIKNVNTKWHADLEEDMLSHQIRISYSDDGAKTQSGKWKSDTLTINEFIKSLSNFEEGPKDGRAILQGECINGVRTKDTMKHADILMLDFDSGVDIKNVSKHIKDAGLAAVIYTTHSHGSEKTKVSIQAVKKTLNLIKEPEFEDIKNYLQKTNQRCPEFLEQIPEQDVSIVSSDGKYILDHPPLPKFRVVFFLKNRFEFIGSGFVQTDRLSEWSNYYTAFAKSISPYFDKSCSDISRLMYSPRKPPNARGHQFKIIAGDYLDLETIKLPVIQPSKQKEDQRINTIVKATRTTGLGKFLNNNRQRFEAYNWIKSLDPEIIRNIKRDGTAEMECPFDHLHSNPGDQNDRACFVINSSNSDSGYFQIGCHHNSCCDRDICDFVDEICHVHNLKIEDLKSFVTSKVVGENGETEDDVINMINSISNQSSTIEINEICYLLAGFEDNLKYDRALNQLKNRSGINLSVLRKEIKKANILRTELEHITLKNENDIINDMDFSDQITKVKSAIESNNISNPRLFRKKDGRLLKVVIESDGIYSRPIKHNGLSTELSSICNFYIANGKDGGLKEVAPFKDVVSHIDGMDPLPFPVLDRVVAAPIFSKDGSLKTVNGYNPETLCYIHCNFDLLNVSDVPSQDEVDKSLGLIYEAIEGFPFSDKFDGSESLPSRLKNNKANMQRGCSSRAGAVSLILTPFVRNMIEGPTPGFCIDKPQAGTGAGYLIDTVMIIFEGRRANATPVSGDKEEIRKAITASLHANPNAIFFDNINRHVDDPSLASAMTAGTWRDRILGCSEMTDIEVKSLWIFAANNGSFSSELMRRFVPIRIDAGQADPTQGRIFKHEDLHEWLFEKRSQLIWACLTIIQNWIAKGRPDGSANMASFNNWASVMSGILESSGIPDLLINKNAYMNTRNQDQDESNLFVQKWWSTFDDKNVTSRELYNEVCCFAGELIIDLPIEHSDSAQRNKRLGCYIRNNIEGKTFDIMTETIPGAFVPHQGETVSVRCKKCENRNGVNQWKLTQI